MFIRTAQLQYFYHHKEQSKLKKINNALNRLLNRNDLDPNLLILGRESQIITRQLNDFTTDRIEKCIQIINDQSQEIIKGHEDLVVSTFWLIPIMKRKNKISYFKQLLLGLSSENLKIFQNTRNNFLEIRLILDEAFLEVEKENSLAFFNELKYLLEISINKDLDIFATKVIRTMVSIFMDFDSIPFSLKDIYKTKKLLKNDEALFTYWESIGRYYLKIEKNGQSAEAFSKALEINGNIIDRNFTTGFLSKLTQDDKDAIALLRKQVLENEKNNDLDLSYLQTRLQGEILLRQIRSSQLNDAVETFDRCYTSLLSMAPTKDREALLISFGHISGYLTALLTEGKPPLQTLEEEEYILPANNHFMSLAAKEEFNKYYKDSLLYIPAYQLLMMYDYLENFERASYWASLVYKNVMKNTEKKHIGLTLMHLLSYFSISSAEEFLQYIQIGYKDLRESYTEKFQEKLFDELFTIIILGTLIIRYLNLEIPEALFLEILQSIRKEYPQTEDFISCIVDYIENNNLQNLIQKTNLFLQQGKNFEAAFTRLIPFHQNHNADIQKMAEFFVSLQEYVQYYTKQNKRSKLALRRTIFNYWGNMLKFQRFYFRNPVFVEEQFEILKEQANSDQSLLDLQKLIQFALL